MNEQERRQLAEDEWLRALDRVTHVPEPGMARTPWCSWARGGADVISTGVVTCPDCIDLLHDRPQYYNLLRAQGLRTADEARHEMEQRQR